MVSIIKLAIVISAVNRGASAFKEAEGGLKGIQAAVKATQAELLALAGVGLVDVAKASTLAFLELNRELARLGSISEEVGVVNAVLKDKIFELGRTSIFAAKDVANAAFFLKQAGLDSAEAAEVLKPVLDLAALGFIDLGRAADLATDITKAFGLEVETQLVTVVDALFVASKSATTSIEQMAEALKFVAPVAGALGIGISETSVALAALADRGQKGSLAGTGLRRVLVGLISPSAKAQRILDQLGITVFDAEGNFVGLLNIVEQFSAAGANISQIFDLFEQRGGLAFQALLQAFEVGDIESLTAALADAEGQAAEATAELEKTAAFRFDKLKQQVELLGIALGEKLFPLVEQVFRIFVDEEGKATFFAGVLLEIGRSLATIFLALVPLIELLGVILIPQLALALLPFVVAISTIVVGVLILLDLFNELLRLANKLPGVDFSVPKEKFSATKSFFSILGFQSGGVVPQSGLFRLEKGETVVPVAKSGEGEGGSRTINVTNVFNVSGAVTAEQQMFENRRTMRRMQLS